MPATLLICWRRQHQGISQFYDLFGAFRVDNFDAHQSPEPLIDIDLARLGDHVVDPIERHFDKIILWIVDETQQGQPLRLHLIEAPRGIWDVISPEARSEFNRRLKAEGKPAGRWGADETAVQRLFGKELLVLLWAIELPGVTPEEIAVAIRNWLGLKPEERWWLYTMTAAATGLSHQQGMGWRGALRQALCFSTLLDAFHLGAVAGRGTLTPRANEHFAPVGKKPKRIQRKKAGADEPGFLFALPAE
jgi:hypothetical protein